MIICHDSRRGKKNTSHRRMPEKRQGQREGGRGRGRETICVNRARTNFSTETTDTGFRLVYCLYPTESY